MLAECSVRESGLSQTGESGKSSDSCYSRARGGLEGRVPALNK